MKMRLFWLFVICPFTFSTAKTRVPDHWKQKLSSVLHQTLPKSSQILDLYWRNLIGPNENFGSSIRALDVKVNNTNGIVNELNLVVKTFYEEALHSRNLTEKQIDTFNRELTVYGQIIPSLRKFQKTLNFRGESIGRLVPKYYGGEDCENDVFESSVLLIENLKIPGYVIPDKKKGLNGKEIIMIIEKIANIHATTIAYKMYHPAEFSNFLKHIAYNSYIKSRKNRLADNARKVSELLKTKSGLFKYRYYKSVKRIIDNLDSLDPEILSKVNTDINDWFTLVHNDLWLNNIMVKRDQDGRTIDMKLIDFGSSYYGLGLEDVISILCICSDLETIQSHFNESLYYYYDIFISHLKSYRIDIDKFARHKFDEVMKTVAKRQLSAVLSYTLVNYKVGTYSITELNTANIERALQVFAMYEKNGWL